MTPYPLLRRFVNSVVGACAFGAMCLPQPAVAEEITIGRWCDRPISTMPNLDRVITIRMVESGKPVAFSKFGDGSKTEMPLLKKGGTVFTIEDSPSGDRYRIVPSTGELQILDNDGFIRAATRLENQPQRNDCFRGGSDGGF